MATDWKPTPAELRTALDSYDKNLTGLGSDELVSLDRWFQTELRDSVQKNGHLTLPDLERVMVCVHVSTFQ
jgi:hypothetical protein